MLLHLPVLPARWVFSFCFRLFSPALARMTDSKQPCAVLWSWSLLLRFKSSPLRTPFWHSPPLSTATCREHVVCCMYEVVCSYRVWCMCLGLYMSGFTCVFVRLHQCMCMYFRFSVFMYVYVHACVNVCIYIGIVFHHERTIKAG